AAHHIGHRDSPGAALDGLAKRNDGVRGLARLCEQYGQRLWADRGPPVAELGGVLRPRGHACPILYHVLPPWRRGVTCPSPAAAPRRTGEARRLTAVVR